jgi:hypothetical protein
VLTVHDPPRGTQVQVPLSQAPSQQSAWTEQLPSEQQVPFVPHISLQQELSVAQAVPAGPQQAPPTQLLPEQQRAEVEQLCPGSSQQASASQLWPVAQALVHWPPQLSAAPPQRPVQAGLQQAPELHS